MSRRASQRREVEDVLGWQAVSPAMSAVPGGRRTRRSRPRSYSGADSARLLLDLLRAIEERGASLAVEDAQPVLLALAGLLTALAAGIGSAGSPPRAERASGDENLSVQEAARRLGVSRDYLYRHAKRLPFTRRIGRRILFSARGLEEWNARTRPAFPT